MKNIKMTNNSVKFDGPISDEILYLNGGYYSLPNGCTVWGTSVNRTNRFIGDNVGSIIFEYSNGERKTVPAVIGYTVWLKTMWGEKCSPFKNESAEPKMVDALRKSLFLKGAFENEDGCILAVKTGKNVVKISVEPNPEKEGYPIFTEVWIGHLSDSFFDEHTVEIDNPFPVFVNESIDAINRRMLTFEEDLYVPFTYVSHKTEGVPHIEFHGDNDAEIASAVVNENILELSNRVDNDGFCHTSGKSAPAWWYDGFGTWLENFGNYYTDFYSRDGGRALQVLSKLGFSEIVEKGISLANKWMMYFPENSLSFNGRPIPGHSTVVINRPMFYSEILSVSGWPTKYTKERFGDDYQKLGNQETDGHGLMMLANCFSYSNSENREKWYSMHGNELKEYVKWIEWCFENRDISLAKDYLLYAESEAGMNEYTLYCNLPCYLGLCESYVIFSENGESEYAEKICSIAQKMFECIYENFSSSNGWKPEKFGFFHDPVPTFFSDILGYNVEKYPKKWIDNSEKVYEHDIAQHRVLKYDGSGGIGYNISMSLQNAALLDKVVDCEKLTRELTRMCYAPKLPNPFIVPEGFSYSERMNALRRQGDLGNLVQLAEALKAYMILIGICCTADGELQIMPRIPSNWNMKAEGYYTGNFGVRVNTSIVRSDNTMSVELTVVSELKPKRIFVRFGPFKLGSSPVCVFNGKVIIGKPIIKDGYMWIECNL